MAQPRPPTATAFANEDDGELDKTINWLSSVPNDVHWTNEQLEEVLVFLSSSHPAAANLQAFTNLLKRAEIELAWNDRKWNFSFFCSVMKLMRNSKWSMEESVEQRGGPFHMFWKLLEFALLCDEDLPNADGIRFKLLEGIRLGDLGSYSETARALIEIDCTPALVEAFVSAVVKAFKPYHSLTTTTSSFQDKVSVAAVEGYPEYGWDKWRCIPEEGVDLLISHSQGILLVVRGKGAAAHSLTPITDGSIRRVLKLNVGIIVITVDESEEFEQLTQSSTLVSSFVHGDQEMVMQVTKFVQKRVKAGRKKIMDEKKAVGGNILPFRKPVDRDGSTSE